MTVKIIYRSLSAPNYIRKFDTHIRYAEWLGYDPMIREMIINGILMKDFSVEVYNDIEQVETK